MTIPGFSAARTLKPSIGMLFALIIVCLCSTTQALRFLGTSTTYARFPKWNACSNASLTFEFKTRQPSALLVYTDDNGRYDFLQLALTKGAVRLSINFVAQENRFVDIEANTDPLNDGQWHRVEIRRNRMETILLVDGTQTSKVSLGSDADFGLDVSQNNHVFFGGVPSDYNDKLRDLALPQVFFKEKFRGELRNILYFNCSCIPVRASMLDGEGVSQDNPEACEVNNPCQEDCPCVSVDDGSGCECSYKKQCDKAFVTRYYLPMDEIDGTSMVNPSSLDSVVIGEAQLTRGVKKSCLLIDGRRQWLRVTGTEHRRECMGDLTKCNKGYYMGMWLQFRGTGNSQGVYLSNGGSSSDNHGVALIYGRGRLEAVFKMPDGREWRARVFSIFEYRWYHIAATWSESKGLYVYVNGVRMATDRTVTRKKAAKKNPTSNGFYIGQANDNSGTNNLGLVLVDDFVFESKFKEEKEVRESGAFFRYYLSMDNVQQKRLEGQGLDGRAFGAVSEVDGKVRGAVLLSGDREYLDLGDFTDTCLSDLNLCQQGVYISMWVMFTQLDRDRTALLVSPAVSLHQEGTHLIARAMNARQLWETRYQRLKARTWYFVELSWNTETGLYIFIDGRTVGYQPAYIYRAPETAASMNMYVGRDVVRGSSYPAATVDELNIYYADRAALTSVGFLSEDRPVNHHFEMESFSNGLLSNENMTVKVLGTPRIVEGRVGSALQLDGQMDALDFGDHSRKCFGNLDLCSHGIFLSLWLQTNQPQNRTYYLSTGSNGITISYENRKLVVKASTTSKTWEVSTSDFSSRVWHFLEVSFNEERGLSLYRNNKLVAESNQGTRRSSFTPPRQEHNRFYMGRGNVNMRNAKYGEGIYDELSVWYADRDYLKAKGYIQRSQPDNVLVHFEESDVAQTQIIHPTLLIRLMGNPNLVPGRVGNALQLLGNGQYADLGQQSHLCMGNLARCPQGITVSAWMKFRRFENNMVFLSTGSNGLLLYFQDGYVLASAGGRDQVSAPKLDTKRWYLIELSWHPDYGLKLYVDNKLRGNSAFSSSPGSSEIDNSHFYIGRPNSGDMSRGRYVHGDFDIDELEVWYARREHLLAFGFIDRDKMGCETFSMDKAIGNRLVHPEYTVRLMGGAELGAGREGLALHLNGQEQYLDLGRHLTSCLGNLDFCTYGFTLSVWLRPNGLTENMHFIAAPSYFLFYEDQGLRAEFNSKGKTWTVGTREFRTGIWQRVTLTWHKLKGLNMYIDDQLMDSSGGTKRLQNEQPSSDHVFVGRNLADLRSTADVTVDELKICYDHLDQLIAIGEYTVEVVAVVVNFDSLRNGYMTFRNRRINAIGNLELRNGMLPNSRAVYLNGRNQYLDFGDNFTCNGNLDSCHEGLTFRLGLKADNLVDGTYFIDSFPVKLYYKNGRLFGQMQTPTQIWTVDSADFPQGQWSRVEMTWHPTQGLILYINGKRVDYQIYPDRQTNVANRNWKTYVGRPVSLSDGTYANGYIENFEFYNAYRNYVADDSTYIQSLGKYLEDLSRVTQRPTFVTRTPQPPVVPVNTRRPDTSYPGEDRRIIRLNGQNHISLDFGRLPSAYLNKTEYEDVSFSFLATRPDGLIWMQEAPQNKMYIYLKDGKLVFADDDNVRVPQTVVVGDFGTRFDDAQWHKVKLRRLNRQLKITVDGQNEKEYTFPRDVQFLSEAIVWLGGTSDTSRKTDGRINTSLTGALAEVLYISTKHDNNRIFRNELNVISQIKEVPSVSPPLRITTTTPAPKPVTTPRPQTTSVSIVRRGVVMQVPDLVLRSGSSLTYNFKTLSQNSVMLLAGNPRQEYMAVELVSGRLYFIHNFGRQDRRTAFSQKVVADGQLHEVEMRFYPTHVDLRVDNIRERMSLISGEQLPANLGTLQVAGVNNYGELPWMMWSRESYLGCLNDLRVNGKVIDFESQVQNLFGRVLRNCQATSQECALTRPCLHGECRNTMTGFQCDCSRTEYRDTRCQLPAWSTLFNGSYWSRLDFSQTLKSHTDDLSLRFRTPKKDGLLFETFSKNSSVFLRATLDDGRVKVETNLGGQLKTMYVGENLNDLQWHTLYIQRRGNAIEVWVDDSEHVKDTLAGKGYYMNIDRVYMGGKDGVDDLFIGHMQNFYSGGLDFLDLMRTSKADVNTYDALPPLVYYPVTFADVDTFLSLAPIKDSQSMLLNFMFKTEDPSGIIFLMSGRTQDYLVGELSDGNLVIQFNTGGGRPLRVASQQKVNDGQWHAVTIKRIAGSQPQFLLTVDGVTSSVSYAGQEGLDLDGPLYIGGAPENVMQEDYIKNGVFSRAGFRGCLASIDINGEVKDLSKLAEIQKVTVYDGCRRIIGRVCAKDTCRNFGECIENGAGAFSCDCRMSAHSGSLCLDEPLGYRYQNFSRPGKEQAGLLVYTFPQQPSTVKDEIAFGVMTKQADAVLLKVFSEIFNDYITFKLRDGNVEVEYHTDTAGGIHKLGQSQKKVNDGKTYHIVRFVRTANGSTLYVDSEPGIINKHPTAHGTFDRMSTMYIGGDYDASTGKILEGFDGIIGGLHINELMVFPLAKSQINTQYFGDVGLARRPFNLTSTGGDIIIIPGPVTTVAPPAVVTTTQSAVGIGASIPVLPPGMGGGGVASVPGSGGLDTMVYPGGDGGSGVVVPNSGAAGSAGNPELASFMASPPSLPSSGPRAGAVMGTILGLLVFASSLMWAFYKCKPGWCTCLKPPADASITAPLLSASNRGAVLAAGGGPPLTSAAVGSGPVGGNGSASGGPGSSFSFYTMGGEGGKPVEEFDMATLRATGTFSNKGTAIGTPQSARAHLGSTASGISGGGYSSKYQGANARLISTAGSISDTVDGPMLTPASMQSYHYEGAGNSTTADYDLVTGIDSGFQNTSMTMGSVGGASMGGRGYSTNTMQSMQNKSMTLGGGSISDASILGGQYSSNTMQSSYNYYVQTMKTVSGQQQMMGYAQSGTVGVPPGALGEEVRVDCCLMTNDGFSVVTGSSLGTPQVWNMQSGELLKNMQGETVGSTNLHLACNDSLLVGAINADLEANQASVPKGVNNYKLQIWDFATCKPLNMDKDQVCSALAMMSDNEKVVFARTDMYTGSTFVVVWDLMGNEAIKNMCYDAPVGKNDFVHFLALSQSDRYAIAGFTNSVDKYAEFIVFDMNLASSSMSDPVILRLDANPECTAVLPRDEAVTGQRNGELVIWSMRTGQPSRQFVSDSGGHAHTREVKAVAVSKDNKYLVSGSADCTVKLWDLSSERHVDTFNGHTDEVWCIAISDDNEIVVSGSRDRTIRLWKLRNGTPFCSFNAGVDIFHVTMSHDKSTIVGLGDKMGARKLVMLQVVRSKVRRQLNS